MIKPQVEVFVNVPQVKSAKPEQTQEDKVVYHDWPFAILFVVNVLIIIVVMAALGAKVEGENLNENDGAKSLLGFVMGMAVLAMLLALVMVKFMVSHAYAMIWLTLWLNVGISVALTIFYIANKNSFGIVVGAMTTMVSVCYAQRVKSRIPFAVANLCVAEAAIGKNRSAYLVSAVATVVQIGWVMVCVIALIGVIYAEDSFRGHYWSYFLLLVSFYWGLQVSKNVSHTTIAGATATFWYKSDSPNAVRDSLKRSLTTSFGSICLGSLIVAILHALHTGLKNKRKSGAAACISQCILGLLLSLMEYLNRWAFVYVGVYGYKFTQAGSAVIKLFRQRGFDAVINDDLIGSMLGFAACTVGLFCAGVGGLIGLAEDDPVSFAIIAFLVGTSTAHTALAVLDSAVATIFVCFAEDPAPFQRSHSDLYSRLVIGWHNIYPDVMVQTSKTMSSRERRHMPPRAAKQRKKQRMEDNVSRQPRDNVPTNNFYRVLELDSIVWEFLATADLSSVLQACSDHLSEEASRSLAVKAIDSFAVENQLHLGGGCPCDWFRLLDYISNTKEPCTSAAAFGVDKSIPILRTPRAARNVLDALILMHEVFQPSQLLNGKTLFVPVVCALGSEKTSIPRDQGALTRAMINITERAGVRFFYNFRAKRGSTVLDFIDKHWDSISGDSCHYCQTAQVPIRWRSGYFRGVERIRALCKTVYQPMKATMLKKLQFVRFIPTPRLKKKNPDVVHYKGLVAGITKGGVLCGVYLAHGY